MPKVRREWSGTILSSGRRRCYCVMGRAWSISALESSNLAVELTQQGLETRPGEVLVVGQGRFNLPFHEVRPED